MDIQRVVVLDGVTMGNGIAQVCAQAGCLVRMVDVSATALARPLEAISSNLDRWVRKGVLDGADRATLIESIETETNAAHGVRDADLVVEAVPEPADIKYEPFPVLEAQAHTLLASNAPSISIAEIAARTFRPDRVIFMNPVPVMQLVEMIRGLGASDETLTAATEVVRRLGKTP
jgi:3-hydroxybutyryl-CoA dehydrogenase